MVENVWSCSLFCPREALVEDGEPKVPAQEEEEQRKSHKHIEECRQVRQWDGKILLGPCYLALTSF